MRRRLYLVLFAGGFLSMVAQLVFLREFLSVFLGNELVLGIILGNWLLFVSLGSFAGRRLNGDVGNGKTLSILLLAIAFSFPFLVFFSRTFGSLFSLSGVTSGIQQTLFSTLIVLAPFCVLNGLLFVLSARMLSRLEKCNNAAAKAYSIEGAGSLLGGLSFTFFLAQSMDSFQVSYLVFLAYAACAAAVFAHENRGKAFLVAAGALLFLALMSAMDLRGLSNAIQYPGQTVLLQRNTLYGNIVVSRTGGQINFFENGLLLFSSQDAIALEEDVHYAMPQHDSPSNVLLVSGGVSGTINEILKYGVVRVDYVEIDPDLIKIAGQYGLNNGLEDERVHIQLSDGRVFLKDSDVRYDVVLINVHDPINAQLNRFYTLEFFNEIKGRMQENGVLSLSLSSPGEYESPQSSVIGSSVFWTLKRTFRNVIVVPGYRDYFIASDAGLTYNVGEVISERGVKTGYVNDDYLRGVITKERINAKLSSIGDEGLLNTDYRPITYYLQNMLWNRQFGFRTSYLLVGVLLLTVFFFILLRPTQLPVFTMGFMGTATEVSLLLAYQIAYGSFYRQMGLLMASFMLGLTLGAFYSSRLDVKRGRSDFKVVLISGVLFPFLAAFSISLAPNQLALFIMTASCGFLVGIAFPLAFALSGDLGLLYGIDLAGAFIGSLMAGAFLIPAVGLINTCVIAGVLNAISLIGFILRR